MNDQVRTVRVNGQNKEIRSPALDGALPEVGVDVARRNIAVAVNGALVPRARWASTPVSASDEIEIIGAMQGG